MVGATPGSAPDVIARLFAQRLSEKLGQPFVVENRGGASGNLATEAVVRAPPDGYTLLLVSAGNAINQSLFETLNFDLIRDIAPIAVIARQHIVMEVNPSVPVRTVPEFIAYAKANPGMLNMASFGTGDISHMSGELFKYMAQVDLTHVPYRGAAPAFTDVIAGRVDCTFAVMASGLPLAQSGQLRALGVTTASRVPTAPEVPTIAEAGVPGYDTSSWFAFFVPAKTPAEIVRKMHADTVAALAEAPIKAKLVEQPGRHRRG